LHVWHDKNINNLAQTQNFYKYHKFPKDMRKAKLILCTFFQVVFLFNFYNDNCFQRDITLTIITVLTKYANVSYAVALVTIAFTLHTIYIYTSAQVHHALK